MGILDRLKSLVGGARDAARLDLRGPLGLSPGDGVGYYRERFVVAGVRRLDLAAALVWQYCLRGRDGAGAVLVVEEGPEACLWLERPAEADLPWERDVIEGLADEPFRLRAETRCAVAQAGDLDSRSARALRAREYRDAEGERRIVLEDWSGRRETRVGEQVHETELTFARAGSGADLLEDDADPRSAARGTPGAAAAALSHDPAEDEPLGDDLAREDVDPTAFDDERWSEEEDEASDTPIAAAPAAVVEIVTESEEDEWRAASRWIRENGIPAEPKSR